MSLSRTSEDPLGPPKTVTRTPAELDNDHEPDETCEDYDNDQPIELKVKAILSGKAEGGMRGMPSEYLDVPVLNRQLSNLAREDERFIGHRNSLVLIRRHQAEEARVNQKLQNVKDSLLFVRVKRA